MKADIPAPIRIKESLLGYQEDGQLEDLIADDELNRSYDDSNYEENPFECRKEAENGVGHHLRAYLLCLCVDDILITSYRVIHESHVKSLLVA